MTLEKFADRANVIDRSAGCWLVSGGFQLFELHLSAAMAVSIPRPSFPPPTSALPLLPAPKVRTNHAALEEASRPSPTSQNLPKLALRTPSKSIKPPTSAVSYHALSTPTIPTLRSTSTSPGQDVSPTNKDVRRSVSIASFPQPPKVGRRLAPESRSVSSIPSVQSNSNPKVSEKPNSPQISGGGLRARRSKTSAEKPAHPYTAVAGSPSLLNGSGDGKSISGIAGARGSDGLNSLLSPSQSRSSSAQGSYSTSATTFEDIDENARRVREDVEESVRDSNRQSTSKEGKGNVIVSVRVRPDAAGNHENNSEGEWMVDGRRSLVAYRGREKGDYYYGQF